MAAMLETPSRVWRRIEAVEGQDMPSLPSVPFEDSSDNDPLTSRFLPQDSDENTDEDEDLRNISSPRHSTPASQNNTTIRPFSSANATARLRNSLTSRRSFGASRSIGSRNSKHDSFNINKVPSLPRINVTTGTADDLSSDLGMEEESKSRSSVPDVYLPPPDDEEGDVGAELSITDALQSVSRTSSPTSFAVDAFEEGGTPKKGYDDVGSLTSQPKLSPFDRFQNVVLRRNNNRLRTPSLTHTVSSQSDSPTNSTPQSNHSSPPARTHSESPSQVPLPRSRTTSPAVRAGESPVNIDISSQSEVADVLSASSMDVTDHYVAPYPHDESETGEDHGLQEESDLPSIASEVPSRDSAEPTFSSDDAPTPYSNKSNGRERLSSPGSMAFTPTPAFPRPRARFNLPSPPRDKVPSTPAQNLVNMGNRDADDLITPHTRRRSFLLSVINSTARPRLRMATPHLQQFATPGMASMAESTPGPSKVPVEVTGRRTVLAGVTPRPPITTRRRISHPLAQAYGTSPAASDNESVAAYENDDRMSMVSTTSSQDLTSHPRANASFDPAMGFGAGATGHGVGRFNAGKLNNYLHTLNRRLQEENEILLERLRVLEEEEKADHASFHPSESSHRLNIGSTSNRRLSAATVLNDVEEDPVAERWLEEKAELEEMVESFKDEVTKCMAEKEEYENALEKEKHERERDKERWKERMVEVEAGVSELVGQLEQKLEATERKAREVTTKSEDQVRELNRQIEDLQIQVHLANERAEKAGRALESDKDLGGALNEANERLAQATTELRNANMQIEELEKEALETESHIDELEVLHKKNQEIISTLEDDLDSLTRQFDAEKARVRELEVRIQTTDNEFHEAKAYIEELEGNTEAAAERLEDLETEIVDAQNTIKKLEVNEAEAGQQIAQLEEESAQAQEVNTEMEAALKEAEQKMREDNEALVSLKAKVIALEREKERVMVNVSQNVSRNTDPTGTAEEDFEALELELDSAHKEIARLNALLVQSPVRRAMEKVKDARIEMLEKEKEELLERNRTLRATMNEMTTPQKVVNTSGISPIHRQVLSLSIRAPRTPGPPLRDLSWLNSTMHDPSVSPLVAEISRLQKELDRANESIDDKIDKLEDAGLGVVGLTQKLEDARTQISSLEDEIARLKRTEERRSRRLERMRCQKCKIKVDVRQLLQEDDSLLNTSQDRLPIEPPTPPTRTSEVLRQDLQVVNEELTELKKKWQVEKKQLVNENVALQNAAKRLNAQVKEEARRLAETERIGEKKRMTVENELENARKTISELEGELKLERSRLRNLDTQQIRMQRDRDELMNQLKRTESDMDDVRDQLHKLKQESNEVEKELRENATVGQKARLLEKKVGENQMTIENLRQERASLSADYKDLQQRYIDASERADRLRKEYASASNSHKRRRTELDDRLLEIEDLKRALQHQDKKAQLAEDEKDRVVAEKHSVAETIAVLEADLKRVRRNAETFGRDLKILRAEKEKAETRYKDETTKLERAKKQAQAQLRLMTEELDLQKQEIWDVKAEMRNHVCAANDRQVSTLKLQHNRECKGLLVQIRYLKAKFTREALFRDHLGYQKQYLLEVLSQFEQSERTILVSIARIGYPSQTHQPKRPNKFRAVGIVVIFLSRVRRLSAAWRRHSASKREVIAALDQMHARRNTAATS